MSFRRLGEWRDLARTQVLQHSIWDGGRGDVSNDPGKQITVSGLGAKVVPVLSAHAQGSRFTESWHSFESYRDEIHDIRCEYV